MLYDAFGRKPQVFALDRYEYTNERTLQPTAEQDKEITEDFSLELNLAEETYKSLDYLHEDIGQSALRLIADLPLDALKMPTPQITPENNVITPETAAFIVPLKRNNNQNTPQIAIVIDDVGLSTTYTKKIAELHKPITASMLTYGAANSEQARMLQNAGIEIMVHVPMMPHIPANLAPVTLSPEMSETEIKNSLTAMLDRYKGINIAGINNHMGSLFTERAKAMGYVMEVLHDRGLFFLDSKTTAKSVGKEAAEKYAVPYITRDVFLDNENKYDYIMGQLKQTERVAARKGQAIAIGHPHSETIKALQDWLPSVENRGFRLVRISELLPQNAKKD